MTLLSDLAQLREDMTNLSTIVTGLTTTINLHEEQLNGKRGIDVAIKELAAEIKSLRKAAYWVASVIVAGSIAFAFTAMSLVGGVP